MLPVLLLSKENMNRAAQEIELRTEFVLQESSIWLSDILRKIAEESERR